jgi:hypothetical protein
VCQDVAVPLLDGVVGERPVRLRRASVMILHTKLLLRSSQSLRWSECLCQGRAMVWNCLLQYKLALLRGYATHTANNKAAFCTQGMEIICCEHSTWVARQHGVYLCCGTQLAYV